LPKNREVYPIQYSQLIRRTMLHCLFGFLGVQWLWTFDSVDPHVHDSMPHYDRSPRNSRWVSDPWMRTSESS